MLKKVMFSSIAIATAAQAEIRVITDRTEATFAPILAEFEKQTGTKVKAVYLENGLLTRLESRPDEADVVVTKDAELLEIAKQKKLLKPLANNKAFDNIAAEFVDSDRSYIVDAYRARAIFYSKDRVKPSDLSTYEALTDGKWKGRICVRPGLHDYNVALFSQMFEAWGEKRAKEFIKGLKANLAVEPRGNDREQAKLITEKVCDVALMNTYYHPIMLSKPDQKPWAEATAVFYPEQNTAGTFIMRSAVAVTKPSSTDAERLVEFILSEKGQTFMVQQTFQFPTNKLVKFRELVPSLVNS